MLPYFFFYETDRSLLNGSDSYPTKIEPLKYWLDRNTISFKFSLQHISVQCIG